MGPLRYSLQTDEFELLCPSELSQEAFWGLLIERFPSLNELRRGIRLAREDAFLSPDKPLSSGDEIVLIPPVSGG
jgi:molybdopterin converting factor small subunit